MNIVMAMTMGGDDFIPKPVDPMVLTAKVTAILRRSYEIKDVNHRLEYKGIFLDLQSGSLICDERIIDLTKNEFRILEALFENSGKIVSRESLMNRLWQNDIYVEENTLTVNITRLRKKLEENGIDDLIITRPGSGYILG